MPGRRQAPNGMSNINYGPRFPALMWGRLTNVAGEVAKAIIA